MSMSCLINSPNLKVLKRTGCEGPRHDPYGFEEYDVRRGGWPTLKVHIGLGVWVEFGTQRLDVPFELGGECRSSRVDTFFVAVSGYTRKQLERFARKARARCPCGSKSFEDVYGYPGEHVTMCSECHRVMSVTFNEAAVI